MSSNLAPLQLGFGTSCGAEASTHAGLLYLHNAPQDHSLIKLDFQNAFNSLTRDKMLEAVHETVPELFPFVHSVYEKPSSLFMVISLYILLKEFNKETHWVCYFSALQSFLFASA